MHNNTKAFTKRPLYCAVAAIAAVGFCANLEAKDEQDETFPLEEIVITGTHIKGTATDMATPVSVMDRSEMAYTGSPSVVELMRNMPSAAGGDGEGNTFGSHGLEGTANVNLRGLGPGRTLVLLNGRRQTFSPQSIATDKMLFVDINVMPDLALERMEVLKEGAAATYGSDAMAGVVNFITRSDFEGLEFSGSFKDIDGSNGDSDFGLIWGVGNEQTHWVTSLGYSQRSRLKVEDGDDKLLGFAENPQGGWSSIGNPVTIHDITNNANTPDPNCNALGGHVTGSLCRFQYTPYFNLIEDEQHFKVFSELNHEVSDKLNLHAEVLYAQTETRTNGSPSSPPTKFVDPVNRFVPDTHPGWQDMVAQFPSLDPLDDGAGGVTYQGRILGVAGPALERIRDHETVRVAFGADGTFDNGISYDAGVTYSQAELETEKADTFTDRLRLGLLGLGRPDCTGVTPGANGCEYYNPFSNAIAVSATNGVTNPSYNPAVANSPEMLSWLQQPHGFDKSTDLFTAEFTFSGKLDGFDLAGGKPAYAVGAQYRRESYEVDPIDATDASLNPCPTPGDTSCATQSGLYGFEAPVLPFKADQDIIALYGELALPFADTLDMQLAVRFEDYGGAVGHTLDPKIALRWQVMDKLALRASASTTFRGPTLNQLGGVSTALSFVAPTGAFKPIDSVGNPDLDPESAVALSAGLIAYLLDDDLTVTLDYWSFDIKDPILVEPSALVLAAAQAGDAPYVDQVQLGTPGDFSTVERITSNVINGPGIQVAGIDFSTRYTITDAWSVSLDATYNSRYDVDKGGLFSEEFSAVGKLNQTSFVRPLPRWKGRLYTGYDWGNNNLNLVANYVHHYNDERNIFASNPDGEKIDSHLTFDLNYNYQFSEDTRLSVSLQNLTDETAPFARLDTNYDPYTHNPLGRTVKLSFSHLIGGD